MQAELGAYIKPGEFVFCSRCGSICKPGSDGFMCIGCISSLFSSSEEKTLLEMDERLLERKVEIIVSDVYKEYRKDLTELRKVADDPRIAKKETADARISA